MSHPQCATQALPFASILYNESLVSQDQIQLMTRSLLGNESLRLVCDFFPMKDYYSKEMGEIESLKRFFVVGSHPIARELFVDLKLKSYELENSHLKGSSRAVNIDIGLIQSENLILATFKSYAHRLYLRQGVYAELVYLFQGKSYQPLDWTYPDYRSHELIQGFNWFRQYLLSKLTCSL